MYLSSAIFAMGLIHRILTSQCCRTVDLQAILRDPNLISALASQHPACTAQQENLQSLLKYNQDLTKHLLELQARLDEQRASTETLLLKHQSLEVSWRKKQSEMDAALAPWSPKALYQRLSASISEQEAVCRAVEESFLEKEHHGRATEKEVADWVRRVRAEAAKLAARREAKARWDEGRVGGWR
jgi:chromosome segregation ATPase